MVQLDVGPGVKDWIRNTKTKALPFSLGLSPGCLKMSLSFGTPASSGPPLGCCGSGCPFSLEVWCDVHSFGCWVFGFRDVRWKAQPRSYSARNLVRPVIGPLLDVTSVFPTHEP